MNRLGEKIVFAFMILQSVFCGGIYMYSRMEKWNLTEKYTLFMYPFLVLLIAGYVFITFAVSVCYFVFKIVHTGKLYFCMPVLLLIGIVTYSAIRFSELNLRMQNFTQYQEERNEIVTIIMEGELVPDENGNIQLPAKYLEEEMARGGRVSIVYYQGKMGIYFCTYTGLMESTAGYVYLTDNVMYETGYPLEVILHENYADEWYFCGTYDQY